MGKIISTASKLVVLSLIRAYRYFVSPLFGQCCRFTPSCSCYAIEAIQTQGLLQGCFLTFKRIIRCHPWTEGGVDPVPEIKNKCQRI